MKNLTLLLLIIIFPICLSAQEIEQSQVPAKVLDKVTITFSSIRNFTWKRNRYNYEAYFILKDKPTKVLLDEYGNIYQTETTLALTEIPTAITNYISTNYKPYTISNFTSNDSGGRNIYFVKIKKESENSLRLLFSNDGTYIKTLYE